MCPDVPQAVVSSRCRERARHLCTTAHVAPTKELCSCLEPLALRGCTSVNTIVSFAYVCTVTGATVRYSAVLHLGRCQLLMALCVS